MSILEAIIQGIVQGLTEFLPISSSGHLAITQHIMGVTENNLFFNVMLHLGTLVAVCIAYNRLLVRLIKEFIVMVKDIFTGKFSFQKMNYDRNLIVMLIVGLLPLFLLFIPIPFANGLNSKDLADIFMGSEYFMVVGFSLITTSILLFLGDKAKSNTIRLYIKKGRPDKDTAGRKRYRLGDALMVGLVQCIAAVFPGLSRSGSTLAMGELRGINKQKAMDYTFILAIPSVLAAALLELKDAVSEPNGVAVSAVALIVGMITAAVVGYFSIFLFKWLLKTDKMYVFMIYTLVVGLIVVLISIVELITGNNIFSGEVIFNR